MEDFKDLLRMLLGFLVFSLVLGAIYYLGGVR